MQHTNDKNIDLLSYTNALGKALKTKIKLFTRCELIKYKIGQDKNNQIKGNDKKEDQLIICLGRQHLLILNSINQEVKYIYELNKISNIVIDKNNNSAFVITFIDKNYWFLKTQTREKVIHCIISQYSSYMAINEKKIKQLPLYEKEVLFKDKENFIFDFTIFNHKLPNTYIQSELENHAFFIHNSFIKFEDSKFKFIQKIDQISIECELFIEMSLEKDLNKMYLNEELSMLDYFTYNNFVNYMKIKYESKKFYVIKDCCYIKKYNINNDSASWEGWRILAIIPDNYIKIDYIILRRKFIPPFLEKYSDYLFTITYKYEEVQEKYLRIITNKDYQELNKDIEIILDSLYNLTNANFEDYQSSIIIKYESLCMHSEVMAYISNNPSIKNDLENDKNNKIYELGKKFTELVIKKLYQDNEEINKRLIIDNEDKNKAESENNKKEFQLNEILKKFHNENISDDDMSKFDSNKKNLIRFQWEEKVLKYFYFCLDGGIYEQGFNIETFLKYMNNKYQHSFKDLLIRMLFPNYKSDVGFCINEIINKKLTNFNLPFLCKIIENYDLNKLFEFNQYEPIVYKFICFLVENFPSIELLESLYKHFKKNDSKDSRNNLKYYSEMIKSLIIIYKDTLRCPRLPVLACKIIIYLCSYLPGDCIQSLINYDIITHISNNLKSYDYSIFQLSLSLLSLISEKVKKQNCLDSVGNNKYIFDAINTALYSAKYRDEEDYIYNPIIKILFNLLASQTDNEIIFNKILANVKNNIPIKYDNYLKKLENDNNIISNIINYLKKPYFNLQLEGKLNDKILSNYDDDKKFNQQCVNDIHIFLFLQLLLKSNSNELTNIYLERYQFYQLLKESGKIYSYENVFIYFVSMEKNKKDGNTEYDINKFKESCHQFLKFTYFLLDSEQQYLNKFLKDNYCNDIRRLSETMDQNTHNNEAKAKSIFYSIKNILTEKEPDDEIDIIIKNRPK